MYITEDQLVKGCILCIAFGLVILYFIAGSLEPQKVMIANLTADFSGKLVNISGVAGSVKSTDKGLFFDLKDGKTSTIIVAWNDALEQAKLNGVDMAKLKDGSNVTIVGIVQVFKGKLEVVPTKGQISVGG